MTTIAPQPTTLNQPQQNTIPLLATNPHNVALFMSFFSPMILIMFIIGFSFISKDLKGFVYLGFLIFMCMLREFAYSLYGTPGVSKKDDICNSIQYSRHGNASFSSFVFGFTIAYLTTPMFINNAVNFWLLGGLLFYFFLDMFVKMFDKCTANGGDILINALLGIASACFVLSFIYTGGANKLLFFDEAVGDGTKCSMAKNQTFKCSVYKNGELIGSA
jgi:hypothetical protein